MVDQVFQYFSQTRKPVRTKLKTKYKTDRQILGENPLSLFALAMLLPQRPDYHTVRLWATKGRRSDDGGSVIKLGTVATTNGRASSLAAYQRFMLAINGG